MYYVNILAICRFNVMNSLPELETDVVNTLDEEDRLQIMEGRAFGRKRGIHKRRACRMLGPLLPIFGASKNVQHPLGPSRPLLLRPAFVTQ